MYIYRCPYLYGYRNEIKQVNRPPMRAVANIMGGTLAPNIKGTAAFRDVPGGTEVTVEVNGLPPYRPAMGGRPQVGPFGFHIHEGGSCKVGNNEAPFPATGSHWNPTNQPHGNHAGDFPVLFSNNGYSRMTFFTNKFKIPQIIGKTIVIHESPDDYGTQPSGNSGRKLACGVIQAVR